MLLNISKIVTLNIRKTVKLRFDVV